MHIKAEKLDLMRIFKIFAKKDGFISYEQLKKILDLVGFAVSDTEFRLLVNFADENNDGSINSYEFAN
jgi:Ca2+-binding EF-hand superfamily protein